MCHKDTEVTTDNLLQKSPVVYGLMHEQLNAFKGKALRCNGSTRVL